MSASIPKVVVFANELNQCNEQQGQKDGQPRGITCVNYGMQFDAHTGTRKQSTGTRKQSTAQQKEKQKGKYRCANQQLRMRNKSKTKPGKDSSSQTQNKANRAALEYVRSLWIQLAAGWRLRL